MLHKAASERDEVAWEEFRTYIQEHLVAEQVITVDESSKDDRTIFRRFGCAPRGHWASIDADFVRGDHYSIVAALSVDGYLATRVVPGSVDGDEFFEFIVEDLVHNSPCSANNYWVDFSCPKWILSLKTGVFLSWITVPSTKVQLFVKSLKPKV